MHSTPPKSILIFRLSALGDAVMMLPLLNALRCAYPNATITWVTTKAVHDLLHGLPGVNFLLIEKPTNLFGWYRTLKKLRQHKYDLLIAAQAAFRANVFYPFLRSTRKLGFSGARAKDLHQLFVPEGVPFSPVHLVDAYLGFAEYLGLKKLPPVWNFPLTAADLKAARSLLAPATGSWLAINPMASSKERTWSLLRYVELINRLSDLYSVNVVLLGAPTSQEVAFCEAIVKKTKHPCLMLTGRLSLKVTAALLSLVDVLVAPDTGPVHIANSVGTPVVGLYAVASPAWCGPYASRKFVVNRYPDAVMKFLGKDPLTTPWGLRVHHSGAMSLISVDDVLKKIKDIL